MVLSLINKVRLLGFRGCCSHLRHLLERRRLFKVVLATAGSSGMDTPRRGVTLLADMSVRTSLGKVMRDLKKAIESTDVPCQVFDLSKNDFAGLDIARYTDVIEMFTDSGIGIPGVRRSTVVFTEFETGLRAAHPPLRNVRSFIGMTDFIVKVIGREFENASAYKLVYPFSVPSGVPSLRECRSRFGFGADDFIVFFNFDTGSSFNRKNPIGALRAFAMALKDKPDAKLVFKTMNAKSAPGRISELRKLAEDLGVGEKLHMINDYLPDDDVVALTNCCDVYISLHRGEGLGLGILEAMSMGKAVVATAYSGSEEMCNDMTSVRVPYEIVPVPPTERDHASYTDVEAWAEPDIVSAANALRGLYDQPAFRKKIGDGARRFVRDHFSSAEFERSLNAFLDR